jgi:hypothetical protein
MSSALDINGYNDDGGGDVVVVWPLASGCYNTKYCVTMFDLVIVLVSKISHSSHFNEKYNQDINCFNTYYH